jgi:hypothetical protein
MEILYTIKDFFNANFIRFGFVIVFFIYLLSLVPQLSSRLALQFMRWLILGNVIYSWVTYIVLYFFGEELFSFERATGPYAPMYFVMLFCSLVVPLILFIPSLGKKTGVLFLISLLSNLGFWMERLVIITTSIHRDYLPPGNTNEIDFFVEAQALVLVHCLTIALIFVLLGTWIEKRNTQALIQNTIS